MSVLFDLSYHSFCEQNILTAYTHTITTSVRFHMCFYKVVLRTYNCSIRISKRSRQSRPTSARPRLSTNPPTSCSDSSIRIVFFIKNSPNTPIFVFPSWSIGANPRRKLLFPICGSRIYIHIFRRLPSAFARMIFWLLFVRPHLQEMPFHH